MRSWASARMPTMPNSRKHIENWLRNTIRMLIRVKRLPKNSKRHPRRTQYFQIRRRENSMINSDLPHLNRAADTADLTSTALAAEIYSAIFSVTCSGAAEGQDRVPPMIQCAVQMSVHLSASVLRKLYSDVRSRSRSISEKNVRPVTEQVPRPALHPRHAADVMGPGV